MRYVLLAFALLIVLYDQRDTPIAVSISARLAPSAHANTAPERGGVTCTPGGIVAAVIRNDGTGWRLLHDADHAPLNVTAVSNNHRSITVSFAFKARRVRTFIAGPDETLAIHGIVAGASVGLTAAHITLSRPGVIGAVHVSPSAVTTARHPFSNLWIYGVFDASCDAT